MRRMRLLLLASFCLVGTALAQDISNLSPGQNHSLVYVANSGSALDGNTVSVIDATTNTVVSTVVVGQGPIGIDITPNGKFAYVSNSTSNSVSVIDTGTNTVVATVGVGIGPHGIAITPNGRFAYVANTYSGPGLTNGSVSVIDTGSNTVVATIDLTASTSGEVAITPNGRFAYVSNVFASIVNGTGSSTGSVSVIDIRSNTVVATIPFQDNPFGVAITPVPMRPPVRGPASYFAYVTNLNLNQVSVIEVNGNNALATIGVGSRPIEVAFTPRGDFAYVSNSALFGGTSSISVIDTDTNTVVATVTGLGVDPQRIAFLPNGGSAYVANQLSNTVSVIDTATNTVVTTIPVGIGPVGVAVTP